MNRHPHRPLLGSLIGAILLGVAFGASAHDHGLQANVDTATQANVEATAKATATAEASADAASLAKLDAHRNCMRYTGTRIVRNKRGEPECLGANGRVYSRADIENTGSVELSEALRKLDPSIR